MAILMRVIYLILLSFSLQLLTYTTVTTAQATTFAAAASVWPVHPLHSRSDLQSFVCQTSKTSPFNTHVIFGTNDMVRSQGHHWCTQDNRYGSQCVQLVNYGTASITMCGEWRTKLRCSELGEAIMELSRNCARNFDGKVRLAGRAIFSWGYIAVGQWRVPDQPKKNDRGLEG